MGALLRFLSFDRAIKYSLLLRAWQAFAGIFGIALISHYFSIETQGYYYTFASLVALQSFVELGLYLVISTTASHEWAHLSLGREGHIEGDKDALSRLVSLGRFVFKWYAAAAFIFLVFAGFGGYWFLGHASSRNTSWQLPWLAHVVFSALFLWCAPFLSLLEGCNEVAHVATFRLWQTLVSTVSFWVVIVFGGELWAAPASSMFYASLCIYYLLVCKRNFFRPFLVPPTSSSIAWRSEILPMQWRLALQGLVNYFFYSLMIPVMFYYYGPTAAGQMGMSQQIVIALMTISMIWVVTKTPRFGTLVAKREFELLDLEWRAASLISLSVMVIGVATTFALLLLLNQLQWEPIKRLLFPLPFLLLALGAIFGILIQFFAIYLRAHKKEVLTTTGVISGVLIGALTWKLGAIYGPIGATGSYLAVISTVTLPMTFVIWKKSRLKWHK